MLCIYKETHLLLNNVRDFHLNSLTVPYLQSCIGAPIQHKHVLHFRNLHYWLEKKLYSSLGS